MIQSVFSSFLSDIFALAYKSEAGAHKLRPPSDVTEAVSCSM